MMVDLTFWQQAIINLSGAIPGLIGGFILGRRDRAQSITELRAALETAERLSLRACAERGIARGGREIAERERDEALRARDNYLVFTWKYLDLRREVKAERERTYDNLMRLHSTIATLTAERDALRGSLSEQPV